MEKIPAKTIITKAKSSGWFGMDYNMNIYRGCSHGCIYCDSRSECYRIDGFDVVKGKENALEIIRNDLRRKVQPGVVATGSMSDPYNPMEELHGLTRKALELINAYEFGIAIATKSPLVTRDIDILTDIKEHSPVLVKMTITAADDQLSRKIEPHVAPSSQRFQAIRKLSEQGIYCGILLMPVLPFINDTEGNILSIVEQAKASGAKFIYPAFGVTMRDRQRTYFYQQLEHLFPGLQANYQKQFGNRYQCISPNAKRLWSIFSERCDALGLHYQMQPIIRSYKMGYRGRQLSFIDGL